MAGTLQKTKVSPLYSLPNSSTTGLDKIPLNTMCIIEEYNGKSIFFMKKTSNVSSYTTLDSLLAASSIPSNNIVEEINYQIWG